MSKNNQLINNKNLSQNSYNDYDLFLKLLVCDEDTGAYDEETVHQEAEKGFNLILKFFYTLKKEGKDFTTLKRNISRKQAANSLMIGFAESRTSNFIIEKGDLLLLDILKEINHSTISKIINGEKEITDDTLRNYFNKNVPIQGIDQFVNNIIKEFESINDKENFLDLLQCINDYHPNIHNNLDFENMTDYLTYLTNRLKSIPGKIKNRIKPVGSKKKSLVTNDSNEIEPLFDGEFDDNMGLLFNDEEINFDNNYNTALFLGDNVETTEKAKTNNDIEKYTNDLIFDAKEVYELALSFKLELNPDDAKLIKNTESISTVEEYIKYKQTICRISETLKNSLPQWNSLSKDRICAEATLNWFHKCTLKKVDIKLRKFIPQVIKDGYYKTNRNQSMYSSDKRRTSENNFDNKSNTETNDGLTENKQNDTLLPSINSTYSKPTLFSNNIINNPKLLDKQPINSLLLDHETTEIEKKSSDNTKIDDKIFKQLSWYDWSQQNNGLGAWIVRIILSIRYLFTKVNDNKKEIDEIRGSLSDLKEEIASLKENTSMSRILCKCC